MSKTTPSVMDEVLSGIAVASRGPARWFHRVAPEHADTLRMLHDAWTSGKLGTQMKTAARVISQTLQARGISHVGHQGVSEWLEKPY